jgi:hypothetical protein
MGTEKNCPSRPGSPLIEIEEINQDEGFAALAANADFAPDLTV